MIKPKERRRRVLQETQESGEPGARPWTSVRPFPRILASALGPGTKALWHQEGRPRMALQMYVPAPAGPDTAPATY